MKIIITSNVKLITNFFNRMMFLSLRQIIFYSLLFVLLFFTLNLRFANISVSNPQGVSLIRMMRFFLGEETFRDGIRVSTNLLIYFQQM